MNESSAYEWHIELDYMKEQVRHALNNLDSLEKRKDVRGMLEGVLSRLNDLCDMTKGEPT